MKRNNEAFFHSRAVFRAMLRRALLLALVLLAAGGCRTAFTPEKAPPAAAGHELYVQTLAGSFPRLLAQSANPTEMPPPLDEANWEGAELLPLSELGRETGVERLATDAWPRIAWGREHLPELWRVEREGVGIEFEFTGTAFGIYDVIGPDCGQVRVAVDDQPAMLVPRFDAACSYHRPNYSILADGLTTGRHRVRIELGPPLAGKSTIVPEAKTEPERFAGNRWYPAAVMVVGKHARAKSEGTDASLVDATPSSRSNQETSGEGAASTRGTRGK